jgi:hypothetical protein
VPLSNTQDCFQTKLTQKFAKIKTTHDEKFNEKQFSKKFGKVMGIAPCPK